MKKKKLLIEAIIFILIMAATFYSLFRDQKPYECLKNIERIGFIGFCIAVIMLIFYICLESVIIKVCMHSLDENLTIRQCLRYSFAGFFFYCISPAGSAEQPAQLYLMHRDGIQVSKSILVLALITITFKLSIVMFGLGIYLFRPHEICELLEPISLFCILGMLLNGIVVILMICMIVSPETVNKTAKATITFLGCAGIIRDTGKWNKKISPYFSKYSDAVHLLKKKAGMVFMVFLITVIQRGCYFLITGVVCYYLGLKTPGICEISALQGMIQLATEMLPLPGGLYANEMMYMKVFTPAFGSKTLTSLLASRGICFYCQLIICGMVTAATAIRSKLKREDGR